MTQRQRYGKTLDYRKTVSGKQCGEAASRDPDTESVDYGLAKISVSNSVI